MTCRYDVLVVDLDGTLLNRAGRVSVRNREAVRGARAAGIEVIVATGRALVESAQPLREIDHEHLVVAAGGSLLCDVATGRTLQRRVMPHELVRDVTGALLGHGHKVLVLKDSDVAGYDYLAVGAGELDPASEWWFEAMQSTVRFVPDLDGDPHPHDTLRIGVVGSGVELGPIARDLKARLADRAFLQHWPAVTSTHAVGSSTHLLEVFNPDVNKWTMIADYCDRRGVDPGRVVALGDGLNDVEMLRESGLGVAMANATDGARNAADRITDADHEADGAAEAIERILSGAW